MATHLRHRSSRLSRQQHYKFSRIDSSPLGLGRLPERERRSGGVINRTRLAHKLSPPPPLSPESELWATDRPLPPSPLCSSSVVRGNAGQQQLCCLVNQKIRLMKTNFCTGELCSPLTSCVWESTNDRDSSFSTQKRFRWGLQEGPGMVPGPSS